MFKKKPVLIYSALLIGSTISGCALLHKKKVPPMHAMVAIDPAKKTADSLKKISTVKPYAEIITKGTKSQEGFITIHQKDNKYYFEIPDKILNREILVVNRVSKAAAEMRNLSNGYAGDQIGETVYRFEKGRDKKIFLRRLSFLEYTNDSTKSMFSAVQKNNIQAIAEAFPIVAYGKDSTSYVVELTTQLNGDNDLFYFAAKGSKERAGMGAPQNDKSYLDYVHAYPKNIEVRAVKTYTAGLNPTSPNYTLELNSSWVLLDEKTMQARQFDPRVGYFTVSPLRDFDKDPQGVVMNEYVKRWKLEPKPEDVEKYKRGELVKPAKQIVFYIDPVTPKKWVPYLIQGVNDWQKAFEAAGFKNAIIAKEAPTKAQDSTWSIDDARHSAVIYRPSSIANAMGPSTSDPRSGEIIESHIFWYHNVMSILQKWYMMQAGAVDPKARKLPFDDELMGNLIRFVSSHEVGHTLGLRHNFGASSTVPVEKLRDKAWLEKHGHTPSIMDYARFNYVAQPEDHIPESGLFPRIGEYDIWAIKWGYTWHPDALNPELAQQALVKMTSDSLKHNKRLWFGTETNAFDPRAQSEDLGDDAVKAGGYGIKNLKRILPQLEQWVTIPNEDQKKIYDAYAALWDQYQLYIGHVVKNVGGLYHNDRVNGEEGAISATVPYTVEKNAIKFLNDQLFNTPTWLYNASLMEKTGANFDVELYSVQSKTLNVLLTRNKLYQIWSNEHNGTGVKTYTLSDLIADLDKGILKEAYDKTNLDYTRRNLQKGYIYKIMDLTFVSNENNSLFGMNTYKFTITDIGIILKNELKKQQLLFRNASKKPGLNELSRLHYKELDKVIGRRFDAEARGAYLK